MFLFDFNKANLKAESDSVLKRVLALLQQDPNLTLEVQGHTDNVGTNAANMDLSKRRANAVMSALTTRFSVNAGQMEAAGIGMLSPLASNGDEAGRSKNRRVELVKK